MTRSHGIVSGRAGQLLSACTGHFPSPAHWCSLRPQPSVLLRGLSVALSLSPLISSIYRVPVLAKWRVLLRARAPEAGSRAGGEAGKRRRGLEPGPCARWRGREPPAALRPGARHGSTAQHGQGAHVEGAPWLLSGSEGEQQGSHQEGRLMTMFLITTWR